MAQNMSIAHAMCAVQGGRCFYCGVPFTGRVKNRHGKRRGTQWSQDHVEPRSNGKTLVRNMVLACVRCNLSKGAAMPTAEQVQRAAELHIEALNLMACFNGEPPIEWLDVKPQEAADGQCPLG